MKMEGPCLSADWCDAGLIWQNTPLPTRQKTCSFPVLERDARGLRVLR